MDAPPPKAELARPFFARDFPRSDALDELVDAFAAGDYGWVRVRAPELARSTLDAAVRDAARELVARTVPDRGAVWLVVLAAALLAILSAYWMTHGKPPAG